MPYSAGAWSSLVRHAVSTKHDATRWWRRILPGPYFSVGPSWWNQLNATSSICLVRIFRCRRSMIFLRHSFIVAPLLSLNGVRGITSLLRLLLNRDLLLIIIPTPSGYELLKNGAAISLNNCHQYYLWQTGSVRQSFLSAQSIFPSPSLFTPVIDADSKIQATEDFTVGLWDLIRNNFCCCWHVWQLCHICQKCHDKMTRRIPISRQPDISLSSHGSFTIPTLLLFHILLFRPSNIRPLRQS